MRNAYHSWSSQWPVKSSSDMDPIIEADIDELISELKKSGMTSDDPVSKLMVSALLYQARKIQDDIARIPAKVTDRLCSYFIPKNRLDATPALCLVQPVLKNRKGMEPHRMADGTCFTYKLDTKSSLSFYPLCRNLIVPFSASHLLTERFLISKDTRVDLHLAKKGQVWLGLELTAEIETLAGMSFFIKGTSGVLPDRICVGNDMTELTFTTADHIADLPVMEPFDSQQTSPSSIAMLSAWKSVLANSEEGRLVYVTDTLKDRDVFRCRAYPKSFQQMLESNDLDKFGNSTLWILFDFGDEYKVPPEAEIIPNVVPVVNVNIHTVSLTQSSPVAKLTKADGTSFLNIIETSLPAQKQGFNVVNEEVLVRDFDSGCYDPGTLYQDVRNLYNRFVDDYHAFVDYHGLKDGELIRSLRELINRIGKSVTASQDVRNRFTDGTYAMRGIGLGSISSAIKISYLTTAGRLGNTPQAGSLMENRKDAALDKDVRVIVGATGGEDRADADQRYEMLRYYTLTSDRLFTKMDIDAFVRLRLLREFGRDEMRRISHDITVQGAGGPSRLMRGLYVDIRFRDRRNYEKALAMALDRRLRQMILDRACLSMPVIVKSYCTE